MATVATSPTRTGTLSRTATTAASRSATLSIEAHAAHHVLDAVDLEGTGAHVEVGLGHRPAQTSSRVTP